jgi:SIR2-like protein
MTTANPPVTGYAAPMLPIPKSSRWNGVVYLHGLLPEPVEDSGLHRLVVTSGDFGLAYLTERWAARFVSELFRNYFVCFVGYSINDPVLRYMMDALAADRILGEQSPQAYAFGDFCAGQEGVKKIEWEAKGVTPILYEVPAGTRDHSALHRTLKSWAETYRDGVQGRERIVVDYAMTRPMASTRQDDFVGRMLWALSHSSGLPARRFAEIDPAPSLEWLEPLSEGRYRHADLPRFGVPIGSASNSKLTFGLIRRPARHESAPWCEFVSGGHSWSRMDDVLWQLAHWLLRHLNDPNLVLWLAERGGQLHEDFARLLSKRLQKLSQLEAMGDSAELQKIRASSPNGVPNTHIRTVWRLFLTGTIKSPWEMGEMFSWRDQVRHGGLTATMRKQLRTLLAPKIRLRKRIRLVDEDSPQAENAENVGDLFDWDIVLATHDAKSALERFVESPEWKQGAGSLLEDFESTLVDALDLQRELGEAGDRTDRAHWDMPSISDHPQNRGFREWVALVEWLRDAWLEVLAVDPGRAQRVARCWVFRPYPTFKRLALFAASHDGVIPGDEWVQWLLSDDGYWLWSSASQRETCRLLVKEGKNMSDTALRRLEGTIVLGPSATLFENAIERDRWEHYVSHHVWLRLAKIEFGGARLSELGHSRLSELATANPTWRVTDNERDEFPHWMGVSGDADFEDFREIQYAPRTRTKLVEWLQNPPPSTFPFYEDNWREVCRERFFVSFFALCDLAKLKIWPENRWREALQAWTDEKFINRSWRFAAPLVLEMPNETLVQLANPISHWLEAAANVMGTHERQFLALCNRLLSMEHGDGVLTEHPVTRALNNPIGQVTQALLNNWFRRQPNDNQGLPEDLSPYFTSLCDTSVRRFRHGRVLLASRLIPLFRVDRGWTEQNLLPLFNWEASSDEARGAWEGFLWAPRLYKPLYTAFKKSFLETAGHYNDLGEHGRQYAALLTFAALDPVDVFSNEELLAATGELPPAGLHECARALSQALEGAGKQGDEYWRNRISPYWQGVWPKSRNLASPIMSEDLARMAIAARGELSARIQNDPGVRDERLPRCASRAA